MPKSALTVEEQPAKRPKGRPKRADSPSTRRLNLRLTDSEVAAIDALRGELTRSAYVRLNGVPKAG